MRSIASFDGKNLKGLKSISEAEFEGLLEHVKNINIFVNNYQRISMVQKDKEALENFISDYLDDSQHISTAHFLNELPSFLLKYLASFKAFLDHWETYLNRLYGKDSDQFKRFKVATSAEFDEYFSYRFVYELRNFTLHCKFPIAKVKTKMDENKNNLLSVIVNKERLMSDYNWPKKVRLGEMEAEFDLLPHLEEAFNCLIRIHEIAINLCDTRSLMDSSLKIYKFAVDYRGVVGDIVLATIEESGLDESMDNLHIEYNRLPIIESKNILEMFVENSEE
ncbi:hypothetical protein [Saccharibacillus sacchari]|uniref:Uncharacterized protein n=1 Tax=Saccharibacillus sacchari TaxID=456493 RepID=A0ACC6PB20_9BACL